MKKNIDEMKEEVRIAYHNYEEAGVLGTPREATNAYKIYKRKFNKMMGIPNKKNKRP